MRHAILRRERVCHDHVAGEMKRMGFRVLPLVALLLVPGAFRPLPDASAATVADRAFHLRLLKSEPAQGASLPASPKSIRLWFSEKPTVVLSSITITGPTGAAVQVGKPHADSSDARMLVTEVAGSLSAGSYTVRWKSASADGHAVRGEFAFKVQ